MRNVTLCLPWNHGGQLTFQVWGKLSLSRILNTNQTWAAPPSSTGLQTRYSLDFWVVDPLLHELLFCFVLFFFTVWWYLFFFPFQSLTKKKEKQEKNLGVWFSSTWQRVPVSSPPRQAWQLYTLFVSPKLQTSCREKGTSLYPGNASSERAVFSSLKEIAFLKKKTIGDIHSCVCQRRCSEGARARAWTASWVPDLPRYHDRGWHLQPCCVRMSVLGFLNFSFSEVSKGSVPPKVEGTWSCPLWKKYLISLWKRCFLFLAYEITSITHKVVTAELKKDGCVLILHPAPGEVENEDPYPGAEYKSCAHTWHCTHQTYPVYHINNLQHLSPSKVRGCSATVQEGDLVTIPRDALCSCKAKDKLVKMHTSEMLVFQWSVSPILPFLVVLAAWQENIIPAAQKLLTSFKLFLIFTLVDLRGDIQPTHGAR